MHTCNIFVSSPSDVALERMLLSGIVERLRSVFGHRSKLKLMLWEDMPLDARESFQPQLPDPATMDVFILVLWRRMGTVLPDEAIPAPFKGPLTGTEYEFLAALEAQKEKGAPSILVYRRMDNAGKHARDVNAFFQQHFTDEKRCLSKAFHSYTQIAEFESLVEGHLYRWLDTHLPRLSEEQMSQPRQWYSGNPFQGLKAFRFEHASVFCGRNDAIAEALEKLRLKAAAHQPFLLIVGMSGSGKSSMARAGLLPAMYQDETAGTRSKLVRGIMRPADVQSDPFYGLVAALSADSADNLIAAKEISTYTRMAAGQPDRFVTAINALLSDPVTPRRLVLLIDQLEELYIAAEVDESAQRHFAELIQALVEQAGVTVIATLRSDCYHFLGDTPAFLTMKQNGGQLDLSPPVLYNIRQMITLPAQAARLHFEQGNNGEPPLDEVIAESAARSPEGLPLLEFTLAQLYETRTPGGMLTFKQYHALGGIEGAIASHAETVFSHLDAPVQARFAKVFNQLTSCDAQGRFLRKWTPRTQLNVDNHAGQLVDAFLEARLLVSERNPNEEEVVTLAHESLFIHWPRLIEWLKMNRSLLNIRNRIAEQVERWRTAKQDPALLLNPGKPLEDGKALLRSELTLGDDFRAYVMASVHRARRGKRIRYAAIASLVVVTLYALGASYTARQNQQSAERNLAKSQDLIEFLIGDLHTQLEKVGRLDVMQSIGEKAMNYYAELAPTETTASSLRNRIRALYQIGSVYMDTNAFEQATRAFTQSLEQARELTRLAPENYAYVFEQAQAEFWVGYAFWASNDLDKAEAYFSDYRDTAERLTRMQPDNPSAMMEVAYANSNLGTLADSRGRIDLAISYFLKAADKTLNVLAKTPTDLDVIATLADIYSWLGSAHEKQLKLTQALSFYRSELDLFSRVEELEPSYQASVDKVLANNRLAKIEVFTGNIDAAIARYEKQSIIMQRLVNHDPANRSWREILASLHASLGEAYFLDEQLANAKYQFERSFAIDPERPEQGSSYWLASYYQRHYWYWRFLMADGQQARADEYAHAIMSAEVPAAKVWQLRLSSFQAHAVPTPMIDMMGPDALVALLEQALITNRLADLQALVAQTPQSAWQYPELSSLKPDISAALMALNDIPGAGVIP